MKAGLDASIPKYPARFRAKVLGAVFGVTVLAATTAFGMYLWRARSVAVEDWDARGRRLAAWAARDVSLALFVGNSELFGPALQNSLAEPDVAYVSVVDADGTELIRQVASEGAKVPAASRRILARARDRVLVRPMGRLREFVAPVFVENIGGLGLAYGQRKTHGKKLLGWVRLGLSDLSLRHGTRQALVGSLVLGGAVLLLGLFFGLLVAWPLTTPLRRLAVAVDELRKGNLDHRVEIRSRDELGQLADSFNRMAWSLKETLAELERLNRSLEKEVAERTQAIRDLAEFVELLNGPRRVEPLLERALGGLCQLTGARGAVFYSSEREGELEAAAGCGVTPGAVEPKLVQVGKGPLGVAAAGDRPVVVEDSRVAGRLSMVLGEQVQSVLALPVRFGGTLQGLVVVSFCDEFRPEVLELLEQAAGQLAIALSNAKAFEAAESLARELEARNRQLVRQRDILQRQKERLEESNRLKSEFLANTTHELRTPLNAIIGYAQLLLEGVYGPVSKDQVDALRAIDESAQNLLSLINQTLDYAKVEAGQMPVVVSEVDVAALCREVVRAAAGLTRDRSYDVNYRGPKGPVTIRTDEAKVRQVLLNLVSNAVKFTEQGSVDVFLEQQPDGAVALSVRDTGIGIPKDKQEVIFEAFRQLDGSTTRQAGGTGLGLAITKSFVELLGGRVAVESEPGRGSTFTVSLPAQPPSRAVEAGKAPLDDLSATMGVATDLELGDLGDAADPLVGHRVETFEVDRLGIDLVDIGHDEKVPG